MNPRTPPLLDKLGAEAAALLAPRLDYVQLATGEALERPGRPITHLYFPDTALVSFTALGFGERGVEVATVGQGGATGLGVALGSSLGPLHLTAVVESSGGAWRLSATDFRALADDNAEIRDAFLHLAFEQIERLLQGAAANANLDVERRLARWLLIASDAQGSAVIRTTHDRLAALLGVRRPSVSLALQHLHHGKFIQSKRKAIEITDRARLSRLVESRPAQPHRAGLLPAA